MQICERYLLLYEFPHELLFTQETCIIIIKWPVVTHYELDLVAQVRLIWFWTWLRFLRKQEHTCVIDYSCMKVHCQF